MAASRLLRFYRGEAPDAAGRLITEIWTWDRGRLEMMHDYIQWLFPLPEASRFNPDAPPLTAVDGEAFRTSKDLSARLHRSLDLMLYFYGLIRTATRVTRAYEFVVRCGEWPTPLNHNYLRLTRIMLSLHYCGLAADTARLLACLEDIANREALLPRLR